MWRPAAAARNRAPGGPGHRPPGTTTWLRGARCTGCGGNAADGSAAPGRKSPRWSAERRAHRSQGARRARWRDTRRQCACRRSAHPSQVGLYFTTRAPSRRGNEYGCLTSEDGNAATRCRAARRAGSFCALSPCGRGPDGGETNRRGEGCFCAANPSPIRNCVSTGPPSPARGEGTDGGSRCCSRV